MAKQLSTEQLKQQKIAVLFGGDSAEREVSLKSGAAITNGLIKAGYNVTGIDTKGFNLAELTQQGIDRVFIALHGRGGEDGCIQGALEYLNVPYTGSGVLGSALSMDKVRSKQIFKAMDLPTADFCVVTPEDFDQQTSVNVLAKLGNKVMVKPAKEGSSIGMAIATNVAELDTALKNAFAFDKQILVEAWLSGKEFTVAVLGDEVLPPIQMETPHEFYDYQAKYQSNSTIYHCPCFLDDDRRAELKALALRAFQATGAQGWGRVDLMQDADGNFNLLEVNTVPGMTETSLVPKAAKVAGYSFENLVERIIQLSLIEEG
ncbi:D-alanine--D-alanine ligase [Thalassomonas sp. M1454]|uniref:D-alanine--D-alanine ligase n=1 Tax=Thalassomonas sp. M1454 TaxID=2594477 RepID=UPI001180841A|nr:D-alanine--D-alanine ligase [Thalassomonas sp. M1454]TRX52716.1 D-alanine--D-alanine ligase [Thalassomonas sp. M1454]